MAPYPKELRVRVVATVEEGRLSIPEIARLFQVGVTFIKKMLKLHRAGDPLDPRHGGGPTPVLQEKEGALLRQEIRERPDATLAELQKVLADTCQARVSLSTISRRLQVLHLPRKKKVSSPVSATKRPATSSGKSRARSISANTSLLTKWARTLGLPDCMAGRHPGHGSSSRCPGIGEATSRRSALSLLMASARA